MSLASHIVDPAAAANDVRSMRREASIRAKHSRIELYAKYARRVRVERRDDDPEPNVQRIFETGLAARAWTAPEGHAGFAAVAGVSQRAAAWVVERAVRGESRTPTAGLDPVDSLPGTRWDLDPDTELPDTKTLVTAVASASAVRWLEAGITVEVLVGPDDRCAVRRRQRVWAQVSGSGGRLVAKRGFDGWERLVTPASPDGQTPMSAPRRNGPVIFCPDAAAPVVTALVGAFHTGEEAAPASIGGAGWTIADEPVHPAGLSGGEFDDAGFPCGLQPLANEGRLIGRLSGAGTLRRGTFREPPASAPSNLVIPAGELEPPRDASSARSCRVTRLGPELWVLELELTNGPGHLPSARRAHARVTPQSLLERCAGRTGPPRVTASGPIIPGLVFDGLELIDRP